MSEAATLLLWLVSGIGLGGVYMLLLRSSVMAIASGRTVTGVVGPLVLRAGLAVALFVLAAQSGALPILLVLAGLLLVRGIVLRRTQER